MDDPSRSEALRLLRPLIQSGEVLSAEPLLGSSPTLLVRVAKQDDALEKRVRDALRGIGWPIQIAGPQPKSSA